MKIFGINLGGNPVLPKRVQNTLDKGMIREAYLGRGKEKEVFFNDKCRNGHVWRLMKGNVHGHKCLRCGIIKKYESSPCELYGHQFACGVTIESRNATRCRCQRCGKVIIHR